MIKYTNTQTNKQTNLPNTQIYKQNSELNDVNV